MSALVDDFNAPMFDSTRWDGSSSGTVGQTGGRGFIPCTSAYPAIGTAGTYDLTNAGAFVKMTTPPEGNGSREAFLQLFANGDDQLQWQRSGSTLTPRYSAAGVWTDGPALTYDAAAHAWWRIRHAAGNVVWETSADGLTWTNRWSVATPFPVTALSAYMICGAWGSESAANAYVDNFNVSPSST